MPLLILDGIDSQSARPFFFFFLSFFSCIVDPFSVLFPESESFSAATATRGDTLHQNRVWPIVDPFFSSFMASECLNRCISFRLSAPYRPLSFFFARGVFEPPPNRQQRGAAPEVMPKSSRQQGWHIFFCLSLTFNSVSKSPVTNRLAKKYLYVPLLGRYLPSSCFFFSISAVFSAIPTTSSFGHPESLRSTSLTLWSAGHWP